MFRARASLCVTWIFLAALISVPASAALGTAETLADFEGPSVPPEFFTFFGGSTVAATPLNIGAGDPLARPGQTGTNGVLQVDYNVFDFGGFGQAFEAAGPQDWSNYTSFDFWFYGTGSGLTYQAEISDNRSNPAADTSERFNLSISMHSRCAVMASSKRSMASSTFP